MSSQHDIAQQFLNGGVVPADLVGQETVSKTYVDGKVSSQNAEIAVIAGLAASAQNTANTGISAAGAAQSTANAAVGAAGMAQHTAEVAQTRINNLASNAGNSNTEIVDARQPETGLPFPVLGQRLNNFDVQLADIAINVISFGAIGDGVADDTIAINNAANYCFLNGHTLTATGVFKITDTVIFKCNVNMPNAIFEYTGTGTAVIVGDTTGRTSNLKSLLPGVVKKIRTWGSDTGVKLINLYASRISVPFVRDFGEGLLLTSFGVNGCVYNTIDVGHLMNNQVNALLYPGDINAWVNENLFIGGRFSHLESEGSDIPDACHIKTRGFIGSKYQPNNNVFVKPSIEGGIPYYTLDIHGAFNRIIQGRYEGAGTKRAIFRTISSLSSRRNVIDGGYNAEILEITEEVGSQWNELITTSRSVTSGSAGIQQTYKNTGSSSNPVTRVLASSQNAFDTGATDYVQQVSANKTEMKAPNDVFNRIEINHGSGEIKLGDGASAPVIVIKYSAAGLEVDGGVFVNSNAWNSNLFRLGVYRFWVDANGILRMKGSSPTSDTDGKAFSNLRPVPASATATGVAGDWAVDANYLYVCHTANTWKRVAIATW